MSTINNYTDKLEQTAQERNEAWAELSRCLSVHQDNLPQEIIRRWQEVEKVEEKIKLIVEECREQDRKDFEIAITNILCQAGC